MEPLTLEALEDVTDLYVRVSTTEQAEEGYSVDEQTAKLQAYCVAMGYKVNRVAVDPGYSGASLDRPGIREVIADVKRGRCKKVIVWKLDRLSRSQKDTLILLEDVFFPNGCAFVSLNENFDTATPIGRCIVGVLAAFAQMERENIRMRTMMGKQAAVRSGRYTGPCAPFGYQYQRKENGKREIVPDPYTAMIVKEIYTMYNSGASLYVIAQHCMENYGLFKNLKSIPATRIGRIMRNPVYAGQVHIGAEVFEGMHQALVSMETWQAANARLDNNTQAFDRKHRQGLLSGIVFCGCCGARVTSRFEGWGDERERKYICYSVAKTSPLMIVDPECKNRKNKPIVSELDEMILEEIRKLHADPAAFDKLREEAEEEDKAEPIAERLEEVEKQINRLLNLYQTGVVELEELQPRIADLKDELLRLSDRLQSVKEKEDGKLSKASALEAARAFPAAVASGDPEQLRALVRALIEKVVIDNGEVSIYWKFN